VFNTVNLHVYHYSFNNPITIKDPDGRYPPYGTSDFDGMQSLYGDVFSNALEGTIKGWGHCIASFFTDKAGKVGNFFSNIFSGNAKANIAVGVTFNLPGGLIKGTVGYSSDGNLIFNTTLDSKSTMLSALTGLVSPVTIENNGIKIKAGVAVLGITDVGGGMSSVSLKLTSKEISKGIDLNITLSITASVQKGPFGTIENNRGSAGANARQAQYYLDPGNYLRSAME